MKTFIIVMLLSISTLSCEKDKSLLINDIPDWLKTNISGLDQAIKTDPISRAAYTAWVRYEWGSDYFFEYIDPPSSFRQGPSFIDGKILNLADPRFADYEKEKCCMQYVWRGPKF